VDQVETRADPVASVTGKEPEVVGALALDVNGRVEMQLFVATKDSLPGLIQHARRTREPWANGTLNAIDTTLDTLLRCEKGIDERAFHCCMCERELTFRNVFTFGVAKVSNADALVAMVCESCTYANPGTGKAAMVGAMSRQIAAGLFPDRDATIMLEEVSSPEGL
jgi:hypothetical protein